MSQPDTFAWVGAGLAIAVTLVPGVIGAATGRPLPWFGGKVPRPRLWGWGNILMTLFLASEFVLRYVVFSSGGSAPLSFLIGLPFGIAGFILIGLGGQPARTASTPSPPSSTAADGPE